MSVPAATIASARLSALVVDARRRARALRAGVLVSVAERTSAMDPLDMLEALASRDSASGGDSVTGSDRMYWTRPADDFALAGFGAAVVLERQGADRFTTIQREWVALRNGALVDDPSAGSPGVGPVLMGGFAFEADGPRTEIWRDFPAGRLIVPRIQIVASRGEHWLTMNMVVHPDGAPEADAAALIALRARALQGLTTGRRRVTPSGAKPESMESGESAPSAPWRASVKAIVEAIRADTLEKVVLAREVRVSAPRDYDVVAALRHLRAAHQASYVFGCWHGGSAFVGASPELLVRVEGREVRASSLAGSAARGATAQEDAALADALVASAKERVEHEVVRRSLCAGLAELCDDVTADATPSLLSLPQVHHLHTDVRARLREGHSLLELVGRLHPTPAVGGEPRDAALRFIREHEGIDRGWYAGPIGWVQGDGGEFAVALRSGLVIGSEALLYAGCGIVADSDADDEHAESLLKLRAMQAALASSLKAADASPPVRAAAGGRAGR